MLAVLFVAVQGLAGCSDSDTPDKDAVVDDRISQIKPIPMCRILPIPMCLLILM